MALALARGKREEAASLAARVPSSAQAVSAGEIVIAVQAAADARTARVWANLLLSAPPHQRQEHAFAASLARALIARRFGEHAVALSSALEATSLANREGSPDDRLRARVVRALALLDAGQLQAAMAVLGELDAYATVDYRVAWLAWTLHRRGTNTTMAERARAQMETLRGERPATVEPVL